MKRFLLLAILLLTVIALSCAVKDRKKNGDKKHGAIGSVKPLVHLKFNPGTPGLVENLGREQNCIVKYMGANPDLVEGREDGYAISFTNNSGYLEMELPAEYKSLMKYGPFTIACWVKLNTLKKENPVISAEDGKKFSFDQWVNVPYVQVGREDSPETNDMSSAVKGVKENEWHHLVCVLEKGFNKIYYDGGGYVPIEEQPEDFTPLWSTRLSLGKSGADFLSGALDEFKIYDRKLSPDEVKRLSGLFKPHPVEVSLHKPGYKNTIFHSQEIKEVVLEVDINEDIKNKRLAAKLIRKDSQAIIDKKEIYPLKENSISLRFNAVELVPGEYAIDVSLLGKDGKIYYTHCENLRKVDQSPGSEVRVTDNNVILVNNAPMFPIVYWGFRFGRNPNKYELIFKELSDAGVNLIAACSFQMNAEQAGRILNLCRKFNIMGTVKLPNDFFYKDGIKDSFMEEFLQKANKIYTGHPAFFGYQADEILGNKRTEEITEKWYGKMSFYDPWHPFWINEVYCNTPEQLEGIVRSTDITGADIYPCGDKRIYLLNTDKLSVVGDVCSKFAWLSRGRKPIIMTLQGFDFADYKDTPSHVPTLEELRFMSYHSVIRGANGLAFFDDSRFNLQKRSPCWQVVKRMTRELKEISPIILANTVYVTTNNYNKGIEYLVKSHEKDVYIFAVNPTDRQIEAEFDCFGFEPDRDLIQVLFEKRGIIVSEGKFRDQFAPYDAHVYTTAGKKFPEFELENSLGILYTDLDEELQRLFKEKTLTTIWQADWIWHPNNLRTPRFTCYFRKEFELAAKPEKAFIQMYVDDRYKLYINGRAVDFKGEYGINVYNATEFLNEGVNLVALEAYNIGGPGGLIFELVVCNGDHGKRIVSGEDWKSSEMFQDDWFKNECDASAWINSRTISASPWVVRVKNAENFRWGR